jgi:hypothetical protein
MDENDLRMNFPAMCPLCGKTDVMDFQPDYLRAALANSQPIEMWVSCHDGRCAATEAEREKLRVMLGGDARLGNRGEEIKDDNSDPPFASLGSNRPGHEEPQ